MEPKPIVIPTEFLLAFAKRINNSLSYQNVRLSEKDGYIEAQWTDGYVLHEMRASTSTGNQYPNTSFITGVSSYATSFRCEGSALLRALAVAEKGEIVTLRMKPEAIEVETKTGVSRIPGTLEGEAVEICFNASKLRDILKLYSGKKLKTERQVCLQANGRLTAVRVFEHGRPGDFSILMPCRLPHGADCARSVED